MNITFLDGSIREYPVNTTGAEIAKSISDGLYRNAVGVLIDGCTYDLNRPITKDCNLKILTFDDDEGKEIFWHSSSHLMAEAMQQLYPGIKFGIGPSIENGFYYDVDLPDGTTISNEDLPKIEQKMTELSKLNATFERMNVD